jgi:hypothetical protein
VLGLVNKYVPFGGKCVTLSRERLAAVACAGVDPVARAGAYSVAVPVIPAPRWH